MADSWKQGYWRNDIGALRVGATGTYWRDGYFLTALNELARTAVVAGAVVRQGHLRQPDGTLVMVTPGTPPYEWSDGEYIDSTGALIVGAADGSERFRQGFLRLPSGALVVA
jgi:hypothetical protein